MLFDLFVKYFVTPENIQALVWNLLTILCMCLIFKAWNEKWWKSLIPFYGNYLIYKNTWKGLKWLFIVELIFTLICAKTTKFMRKHLVHNVFFTVKTYIETKQLDIDVSIPLLLLNLTIFLISTIIVLLLKRITYVKICSTLSIDNIVLVVGTFLFPELFLMLDYLYYNKKNQAPTHYQY